MKKYKRDWLAFCAGTSVMGAFTAALFHWPLLLVFNMVTLAMDIYLWEDAVKEKNDDVL